MGPLDRGSTPVRSEPLVSPDKVYRFRGKGRAPFGKRGKELPLGWQFEQIMALPSRAPGEGSLALLERAQDDMPTGAITEEEEGPCWWVLSALDTFDGKEARQKYYAAI